MPCRVGLSPAPTVGRLAWWFGLLCWLPMEQAVHPSWRQKCHPSGFLKHGVSSLIGGRKLSHTGEAVKPPWGRGTGCRPTLRCGKCHCSFMSAQKVAPAPSFRPSQLAAKSFLEPRCALRHSALLCSADGPRLGVFASPVHPGKVPWELYMPSEISQCPGRWGHLCASLGSEIMAGPPWGAAVAVPDAIWSPPFPLLSLRQDAHQPPGCNALPAGSPWLGLGRGGHLASMCS